MKYWLIKSEGACYSIDDLKEDKHTAWTGIRNFQARNYMRDQMKKGDMLLFYHSSGQINGVYGLAKVVGEAHVDETALDRKDEHYDPKAVKIAEENKQPLWVAVDVSFVKKFEKPFTLQQIKADKLLQHMLVAQKGMRLSVMPVEKEHYEELVKLAESA